MAVVRAFRGRGLVATGPFMHFGLTVSFFFFFSKIELGVREAKPFYLKKLLVFLKLEWIIWEQETWLFKQLCFDEFTLIFICILRKDLMFRYKQKDRIAASS